MLASRTVQKGPLWWREVTGELGDEFPGHRHAVDHVMMVMGGHVDVAIGTTMKRLSAGDSAVLLASIPHAIRVVSEKATWRCVFVYDAAGLHESFQ